MSRQRNREEVVNTHLATLISDLGTPADAETIVSGGRMPDVLLRLNGLWVVLEGKFEDVANAEGVVLDDARRRIQDGVGSIAVAIVYPTDLRSKSTSSIKKALSSVPIRYRVITEAFEDETWHEASVEHLMEALRRAHESLVSEDMVLQTSNSLNDKLISIERIWSGNHAACDRLSEILGIEILGNEEPSRTQQRRASAAKVSALVLANALIFHGRLASSNSKVSTIQSMESKKDIIGSLLRNWSKIQSDINYVSIFKIGELVLQQLPSSPETLIAVKSLMAEAREICEKTVVLRHDLMGRIYHWLLHDKKHLGTYYTSSPAAAFLLHLAMHGDWDHDFNDVEKIKEFKIADLACGTGTLLMASARALQDRFIRDRFKSNQSIKVDDLSRLHKGLMEDIIYGYDVLPTAIHLTASTLALIAPEIAFANMNMYVMPMGVESSRPRLGSMDFADHRVVTTQYDLFGNEEDQTRVDASGSSETNVEVPSLDLCAMNPPYVRSVYCNKKFGSFPERQRQDMLDELKRKIKDLKASSKGGFGSIFVAIADRYLKPGGRMAIVLPVSMLSGVSWAPTRELIAEKYHLENVISSHDVERPNFSENTNLGEVMFIARKLMPKEVPGGGGGQSSSIFGKTLDQCQMRSVWQIG